MDKASHKKIAIDCFNAIWKILDKSDISEQEKLEAIRLAHTSTWHWYQCGEPINFQRGEWICSRVYVYFGHLEEALYHAKLCRELTEMHQFNDFDLSYSYECLARVYKKLGDAVNYELFLSLTIDSLNQIAKDEDRQWVEKDIQSLKNL